MTDIDNDIQESAVIDKESLSAAKQEIDFLRLSIFDPFLFPISLVIIFQALCIIKWQFKSNIMNDIWMKYARHLKSRTRLDLIFNVFCTKEKSYIGWS